MPHDLHMLMFIISFASCLWVGKAQWVGWGGDSQKCGAGLCYCLAAIGPFFWECPYHEVLNLHLKDLSRFFLV
jgi:hypothetical protein